MTYALCKHCDHFVDVNYGADEDVAAGRYPGVFDPCNPPPAGTDTSDWIAKYIHLEDGNQEFDHNAEPGEVRTGDEWEKLRPDLFKEHPDGCVGPNSRHHSRRGKIDEDEPDDEDEGLPAMDEKAMLTVLKEIHARGMIRCSVQGAVTRMGELGVCTQNHCPECVVRQTVEKLATTTYRKTWAAIDWCADDVMEAASDNEIACTREEAETLLENEEDGIQDAMMDAGHRVIRARLHDLDRERDDDEGTLLVLHSPIPEDWPVQPLKEGETVADEAKCGHCDLRWDDGKVTEMTPAPSGRCPFEAFHLQPEDVDEDEE